MTGQAFPIETTDIYKFFQMERAEIDRLKWIESEKLGHDIGFNTAITIWVLHYKSGWLSEIRNQTH